MKGIPICGKTGTAENFIRKEGKVIQLQELIKTNSHGQSIIFVERVYTAAVLCQIFY